MRLRTRNFDPKLRLGRRFPEPGSPEAVTLHSFKYSLKTSLPLVRVPMLLFFSKIPFSHIRGSKKRCCCIYEAGFMCDVKETAVLSISLELCGTERKGEGGTGDLFPL